MVNNRDQNICPLCGNPCKAEYRDFTTNLFICTNCSEFVMETFTSSKNVLDLITEDEKILLANYFAKLSAMHADRRIPITINNYKEFIKRAKELN